VHCAYARNLRCDVVEQQEQSTEIVVGGKHWVTDEMPAVIAGRACPTTSSAKKERRSRAYLWRPALGSLGRNDQRRRIAHTVSAARLNAAVAIPPQSEP
jgi:hypothetical protein